MTCFHKSPVQWTSEIMRVTHRSMDEWLLIGAYMDGSKAGSHITQMSTPAYVATHESHIPVTHWMTYRQLYRSESLVFLATVAQEGIQRTLYVSRTSWDFWVIYFLRLNKPVWRWIVSIWRKLLHNTFHLSHSQICSPSSMDAACESGHAFLVPVTSFQT